MLRSMRALSALLLTVGTVMAQTPQLSTGGFTAYWQIVGAQQNQMLFKVSATTAGTTGPWVSISFDPNGKSHVASDMYVGFMSTAGTGVLDTFSPQQAQPTYDTSQDALNPNVMVDANGNLNFSFVRNFATADTNNDYQIAAGNTVTVGWGFGGGSNGVGANCQYNYHGKTNRGNANFNLVATAVTPAPTAAGTTLPPTPAPTTAAPTTAAPTFGPTPALVVPAGSFSFQSTNKDFTAIWSVTATNITITMAAICNGYVGVSFSDVNNLSHVNADTIVGWVTTAGAVNLLDAYSTSLVQPVYDTTTQDVHLISGSQNGQGVSITFTRLLTNNDPTQDYQFKNDGRGLNFAWAYSLASPSGTGADAVYAQHPKTTRDNVKVDAFTGKIMAAQAGPTGNQIATSDGATTVAWVLGKDATTGMPNFQFTMTSPAGAKWVGVGFATTRTHQNTDFYVAYADTTGIKVVDLFSNDQTTTENVDKSQDATGVTGMMTANGGIKAMFTRLADTKDTAQDVVISQTGTVVMSVAFSAGAAPVNPVPGQTTNYAAHVAASTAARAFFTVNLFTGAVAATKLPLTADIVLSIIVGAVIGVYALFRFGWKAVKAVKATNNDPVRLQEEVEETYEAPVSAYYYRGSVAVPYSETSGVSVDETGKSSKVISPGSRFKTVEQKYGSALLTTKDGLKSTGNSTTNLFSKIAHTRIPRSQMSVADLTLGLVYLGINAILWYMDYAAKPTDPGKVWGYLSTANALFVALPATRNSLLVWLLGLPFDHTIMYHRWLGRLCFFEATVHFVYYLPFDKNLVTFGARYMNTGLVAWICMAIVWATSIDFMRRRYFNWFFNLHFVFIAFYVAGAYHSFLSFAYFAYASAAIYGLDRLIRLFWGAFPSKTVKLEVISGAVRVVFKKHWAANYKVGQYVFLNFPEIGLLEWHPFTLASGPDEQYCEVMIKGLGDHTKQLLAAAEASRQLWVRVDGPYGKWPYNFSRFRGVVLVAGGVGVTPSMALIRHVFHINRETNHVDPYLQDVYFVWSCRNEREFGWYRDMLEEAMARSALENSKYPRLHGYVHITKPEGGVELPGYVKSGRPNLHEIFNRVEQVGASNEGMRVAVVACGPEVMVSEAWDETSSRTKGNVRFDFHHETFEF